MTPPRHAPERLVVFPHIHKTAGTTMSSDVLPKQYRDASLDLYVPLTAAEAAERYHALPPARRADIRLVAGHFDFGFHEHVDRPVSYFTLLRDPVERIVSLYYFLRQTALGEAYLHNRGLTRTDVSSLSLADFADAGTFVGVDNGQVRALSGVGTSVPFGALTDVHLERAKRHVDEHLVVAGLTERFDESLLLMADAFGWEGVYYASANRNRRKPSREDVPAAGRARVAARNKLDRALYAHVAARLEAQIGAAGPGFPARLGRFRFVNEHLYGPYRALRSYAGEKRRAIFGPRS